MIVLSEILTARLKYLDVSSGIMQVAAELAFKSLQLFKNYSKMTDSS